MLEIIKNTDVAYSETFSKDGSAMNLTGYQSVTLYIFNDVDDTTAVIESAGTLIDAANGIVNFEIDILLTDYTGFKYGQYKLIGSDGEIEKTDIFDVKFKNSFDKV
jgi:hypothetical protein